MLLLGSFLLKVAAILPAFIFVSKTEAAPEPSIA